MCCYVFLSDKNVYMNQIFIIIWISIVLNLQAQNTGIYNTTVKSCVTKYLQKLIELLPL